MQAISSVNPVIIPNIVRVRASQGKLSAPVKPMFTMYAQFKHISGVAQEDSGVPVYKLMILDNLIDQFVAVKGKHTFDTSEDFQKLSLQTVDAHIETYFNDLHQRLSNGNPYGHVFVPENGVVLDMVA